MGGRSAFSGETLGDSELEKIKYNVRREMGLSLGNSHRTAGAAGRTYNRKTKGGDTKNRRGTGNRDACIMHTGEHTALHGDLDRGGGL